MELHMQMDCVYFTYGRGTNMKVQRGQSGNTVLSNTDDPAAYQEHLSNMEA